MSSNALGICIFSVDANKNVLLKFYDEHMAVDLKMKTNYHCVIIIFNGSDFIV